MKSLINIYLGMIIGFVGIVLMVWHFLVGAYDLFPVWTLIPNILLLPVWVLAALWYDKRLAR